MLETIKTSVLVVVSLFVLNCAKVDNFSSNRAPASSFECARPSASERSQKLSFCEIPSKKCAIEHVLIISLDGLRPDALEIAFTPNIDLFVKGGIYFNNAKTTYPPLTLPSHSSMLSGVDPIIHGMTWNDFEPSYNDISVSTIFDIAKKKNLSTAMLVTKEKFRHIARSRAQNSSVDHFEISDSDTFTILNQTNLILSSLLPNLFFIHLKNPDSAGHDHGWMKKEQISAIEECDSTFGGIIQLLKDHKIFSKTAIILTSDHGGTRKSHGSCKKSHMQIPWAVSGPGIIPESYPNPIDRTIVTYDTAATAAFFLGLKKPSTWLGESPFKRN